MESASSKYSCVIFVLILNAESKFTVKHCVEFHFKNGVETENTLLPLGGSVMNPVAITLEVMDLSPSQTLFSHLKCGSES
jgi:hypothetical protein